MRAFLTVSSLALALAAGPAWAEYNCGKATCTCAGTKDCKDLRDSGFCKHGTITCDGAPPICSCEAALIDPGAGVLPGTRVVPGGVRGGVIGGMTQDDDPAAGGGGVIQPAP